MHNIHIYEYIVYMYIYNTSHRENSKANESNVNNWGILINCKWKLLALSSLIIFL